jgi:HPt (histidine-containing phosphotransfer) domain-containing protein
MAETFFNYEEALERLDGDEEFLLELLNELAEQVDESWPMLEEAVDSKDFDNLRATAHSIKGAAANLNVEKMADAFFGLETLGRSNSLTGVEDLLKQAKTYHELLRDFLKNIKD